MENISFNEEAVRTPIATTSTKSFANRLVSWGFAKDEAGANILLIGTAVSLVAVAAAVFILSAPDDPELPPQSTIDATMKRIPAR